MNDHDTDTYTINITRNPGGVTDQGVTMLDLTATGSLAGTVIRNFADEVSPRNKPGRKPRVANDNSATPEYATV